MVAEPRWRFKSSFILQGYFSHSCSATKLEFSFAQCVDNDAVKCECSDPAHLSQRVCNTAGWHGLENNSVITLGVTELRFPSSCWSPLAVWVPDLVQEYHLHPHLMLHGESHCESGNSLVGHTEDGHYRQNNYSGHLSILVTMKSEKKMPHPPTSTEWLTFQVTVITLKGTLR